MTHTLIYSTSTLHRHFHMFNILISVFLVYVKFNKSYMPKVYGDMHNINDHVRSLISVKNASLTALLNSSLVARVSSVVRADCRGLPDK